MRLWLVGGREGGVLWGGGGRGLVGPVALWLWALDRQLVESKMPLCRFGSSCDLKNCEYRHVADAEKEDCLNYEYGFCQYGPSCRHRCVPRAAATCCWRLCMPPVDKLLKGGFHVPWWLSVMFVPMCVTNGVGVFPPPLEQAQQATPQRPASVGSHVCGAWV